MSRLLRFVTASLAGGVGFLVGFYAGIFVILSVFGLDADGAWYPVLTIGLGGLLAGTAIALVASRSVAKVMGFSAALVGGAALMLGVIALDADLEGLIVGAVIVVGIAAGAAASADVGGRPAVPQG